MKEKKIKISELFDKMGFNYIDLDENKPIDVSNLGWEVESFDFKSGKNVWRDITKIVRKNRTMSYNVIGDDESVETFVVSPEHLFFAKTDQSEASWVPAIVCSELDNLLMLTTDGWERRDVVFVDVETDILDIEVSGDHCYFSNDVLSHNTMFGDPMTTPGGKAVPYHSSVRIRLTKSKEQANGAGKQKETLGFNTIAKVFKNRLGPPMRRCEFKIMFDSGVDDYASMRDYLWEVKGVIEKANGWMFINKGKDNEKKFREKQFPAMMKADLEFHDMILDLLEDQLIIRYDKIDDDTGIELDTDSVLEMEQLASDVGV